MYINVRISDLFFPSTKIERRRIAADQLHVNVIVYMYIHLST